MAVASRLSPPTPPIPLPTMNVAAFNRSTYNWASPPPDLYRFNGVALIPVCPVQLLPGEGYYGVFKGRERGVFVCW